MNFGDLKGPLDKMITLLKSIDRNTSGSELSPIASTSTVDPTVSISPGYNNLIVTKTNGSGTVTVTLPDATTYVLSTDGEEFRISGHPLGAYSISLAGGGTFKYYAY